MQFVQVLQSWCIAFHFFDFVLKSAHAYRFEVLHITMSMMFGSFLQTAMPLYPFQCNPVLFKHHDAMLSYDANSADLYTLCPADTHLDIELCWYNFPLQNTRKALMSIYVFFPAPFLCVHMLAVTFIFFLLNPVFFYFFYLQEPSRQV